MRINGIEKRIAKSSAESSVESNSSPSRCKDCSDKQIHKNRIINKYGIMIDVPTSQDNNQNVFSPSDEV